jgi:hypothetical protein
MALRNAGPLIDLTGKQVPRKGSDMSNTRRVLSASVVAAVLVAVTVFAAAAQATGSPSATGGGTTVEAGEKSTFTFSGVQRPDGTVAGHMVYQFRAADLTIHMDIDCLSISGNTAKLSGVITHLQGDAPPFIFVGGDTVFTVVDNGEGGEAPPDLISDVFIFAGASCNAAFTPPPYLPIQGNIQVG